MNIELIGTSSILFNHVEKSDNLEWLHKFDQKCRLATGKGWKELAEETKRDWERSIKD
jgi:hypothetical protein